MGIIEKQAFRNTFYSYLGAALGFITVMWFAHSLTTSENGLIRIMVSLATLTAQFANLGFQSVTIRFFPFFKNKEKGHHGFLLYSILVALFGFLICAILFFVFKENIIESNIEKSKLLVTYLYYLVPLAFFILFFNVFDSYLRAIYSSVVGSFAKEIIQRILILFVLALYFFEMISFSNFFLLYIISTCFSTIFLLLDIIRKGEWHVKPIKGFLSKELKRDMFRLSVYSIISGSASAIILNIDAVIINHLLGESKTGVYSIAFYFGTIIVIPARALYRISSSIVAQAFKSNNLEEIKSIYKKSCNNQLAIGLFLFIGIYTNIDNIMSMLPFEYSTGRNVILIISFGYLIEMATGINQVVLINSKYYAYDTYLFFLFVATIIAANIIFIPIYGIMGSAIATALTTVLGNILRCSVLYYLFKFQPFNINTLKQIVIGILVFLLVIFIPKLSNIYFDIFVRGSFITVLFVGFIYFFNATPDINYRLKQIIDKTTTRFIK